jgi:hypothetical protein
MSSFSNRQKDAFDNSAKAITRAGTSTAYAKPPIYIGKMTAASRLRCDWFELMGATGLLTFYLLEHDGVLAAGGLVGIDLDPACILLFDSLDVGLVHDGWCHDSIKRRARGAINNERTVLSLSPLINEP